MNHSSTPDLPEEQLPQEVTAALKKRYGPQQNAETDIPASVDRAILADAAAYLETISTVSPATETAVVPWFRRRWVVASSGSLAAAMLLFVVWPESGEMDEVASSRAVNTPAAVESTPELAAATADSVSADGLMIASRDIDTSRYGSSDIDRNGEVNILDAFALARSVEQQHPDATRWDQNGDGRADSEDIQLIAMAAVTL